MARVFSNGAATNLRLARMIPALQGKPPDIRFRKGRSDIHYDLLSSGEKEVFNILLNLFSRREHFANTIYFIDELDVHLHTRLQYALLQEIVEHWIPDHSQLWTASHSVSSTTPTAATKRRSSISTTWTSTSPRCCGRRRNRSAFLTSPYLETRRSRCSRTSDYLYHPENIEKLSPLGFDEASYLTAIRASMQTIRDRLLVHLEKSRNGYEIIKTFSRELKDHAIEEIARVTAADDFETFYPFLDMKSHRPSVYLAGFNLRPTDLAATAWMRAAIASVLRDVGVRGA